MSNIQTIAMMRRAGKTRLTMQYYYLAYAQEFINNYQSSFYELMECIK
jgi:hypothetical protein